MAGSASADTSATVRSPAQPVSAAGSPDTCQAGSGSYSEQPEVVTPWASSQALSHQPRAPARAVVQAPVPAGVNVVPPTAVTYCDAAG